MSIKFDDILLQILDEFIADKKVDIEKYCKKYPQHKDAIVSKFLTAEFIKKSFQEKDLSGEQIGDCIILQELNRGGMGIVFLGIQPALSRLTAIKVLPPSFSNDKEALANFQEEAKIIAKFNHPNIVPIYSINNEKGINYISMGYISGLSLRDIAEKLQDNKQLHCIKATVIKDMLQEPFSNDKDISQKNITLKRDSKFWNKSYFQFIATIGVEIADALSYAHQNGISHGDLKPSNILITSEGIPVIVDFGLSKNVKKLSSSESKEFLGTLVYAAPEQIKENIINEKTDIWSLGATLYELLILENPFRGATIEKTVAKILKSCPPTLRHYNRKIPLELEAIILKCLEEKSKNRYSSAIELSNDLNNYLESKPIKAKPIGIIGRLGKWVKRNPVKFYLTIVIFLSILVTIPLSFKYTLNKWKRVADVFYDKGQYDMAIQQYNKVLRFSPSDIQILRYIGNSYYYKGIYKKALLYYERALTIKPSYPTLLLDIGDVYRDTREFDKAIIYYKQAIKLSPQERIGWYYLGNVYQGKKSYDEAVYYYGRAVLLAPEDFDVIEAMLSVIEEEKEITDDEEIKGYLRSINFNEMESYLLSEVLKKAKQKNR